MDISPQLLLRVASWYFTHHWDQDEIARRIGISRSSTSRLIAQARGQGLLDFRPHIPGSVRPGLAGIVAEMYGLRDVVVVAAEPEDDEALRSRLGEGAACYLQLLLTDHTTVGISWGTVHALRALQPIPVQAGQVVQLAGGLHQAPGFGPPLNELVQALAAKLSARPHYLFAPAISGSAESATTMRAEASIDQVLSMAARADIALFGVGDLEMGTMTPMAASLTPEEWRRLQDGGAVGAVCVRFYDAHGRIADSGLDARTIGLGLDQLAAIPTKIALAGGLRKRRALLGAIQAGIVNILITDESLAMALLEEGIESRRTMGSEGGQSSLPRYPLSGVRR